MNRIGTTAAALACAFLAAALWGCGPGKIEGAQAKLPPGEGSAEFLDRLSEQQAVSENDSFRAILLLLDNEDKLETFAQRAEALRARKIIDSTWDCRADRPITRGKCAHMIYQACKVPGGVTVTLFGPSPRYCLRELQYNGLVSRGSEFSKISGMEMLAILNRADSYIQTGETPEVLNIKGGR